MSRENNKLKHREKKRPMQRCAQSKKQRWPQQQMTAMREQVRALP